MAQFQDAVASLPTLLAPHDSLAFYLELSFICFLVCAFFISVVQYIPQFIVAGLALALERISRVKIAAAPSTPEPATVRSNPALVAGGPKNLEGQGLPLPNRVFGPVRSTPRP